MLQTLHAAQAAHKVHRQIQLLEALAAWTKEGRVTELMELLRWGHEVVGIGDFRVFVNWKQCVQVYDTLCACIEC